MLERTLNIDDIQVPRILYGTAWKENDTQPLVESALQQGFRGIDTANQRKHYFEAAVGAAMASTLESKLVTREGLFVQTKFTFPRGQDHRLPYDLDVPASVQVEQSFASSLDHLGVQQVDSYLLHGPTGAVGLRQDDWEAWRAMEALYDSKGARLIGVSNFNLDQLQRLCKDARIRPSFVQNRCYASRHWDREIRHYCAEHGIIYQGFSLLTANRQEISSQACARIAKKHNRSIPQIIFRFAMEVGIIALTGTTDADHMKADLDIFDFELEPKDMEQIETLT